MSQSKQGDDPTLLSWKAPEFQHYKKNPLWFPIQAAVTLGLTTYFVLTKQYLVSIIVILGAIILYRLAHQEPEVLPVVFSPQGIKFKEKLWPYKSLKSFWIIDVGGVKRLYLQRLERLSSPIVILLAKEDIEKVRGFLGHYLPEIHDVREDFAEKLNHWLRI